MTHRIGAQTITWAERNKSDLPAILSFLAEHRFEGVEIGMRHFDAARPQDYRKLLLDSGLVPLGLHSGGQFWDPEAAEAERKKLSQSVDFANQVGFRWLVVSGNKAETVESMEQAASTYGQIGRACRDAGIGFAYHNHNWELADGAAILDTLVACTRDDEVSLVLDVAWAHIGGHSVADLLSAYGHRIAYLHVKDVAGETFCELGNGDMDLEEVLALADRHAIEWMVVEQDYTSGTPEESMAINREFLAARGW